MTAADSRKAREDAFYRELGAKLRAIRLSYGISQDELAIAVGIERVALSRYERGQRAIPLPTLLILAAHLKRPVTDVLPPLAGVRAVSPAAPPAPQPPGMAEIVAEIERSPELIPSIQGFLAALRAGGDEPI
jgi:transcriptional regulator with XRE-family HTH domain